MAIFSPHSVQLSMLLTSSFIWNIPFLWYQDITSPCFLFLCLVCIISPVSYSSFTHTSSVGVPQDSAPGLSYSLCLQSGPSHPLMFFQLPYFRQPWNLHLKLRILFRSSDRYRKMSTKSLRHRQTACSMVPKIQLLFSIPQTHPSSGILYLSKQSSTYPAARGETWVS